MANIDRTLVQGVLAVAQAAGVAIMAIYHDSQRWQVVEKEDKSPLTAADLAAHEAIAVGLRRLPVQAPMLSEESSLHERAGHRDWPRFWLVDPLDGTREFIARNGEFSVNIALVDGHDVVLGVVYGPANGVAYVAAKGLGAFRVEQGQWSSIKVAVLPTSLNPRPINLTVSRRHGLERLVSFEAAVASRWGQVRSVPAGSAFKICAVADGAADAYPRFGPTMEWDTAAAQIVLEEAGGSLLNERGHRFRYNLRETLTNGSFLAVGDQPEQWLGCCSPIERL